MRNAPLIILPLYKDLFFTLLLLERRSEGSKVELMCENMRAKLQCYLEAIVCADEKFEKTSFFANRMKEGLESFLLELLFY